MQTKASPSLGFWRSWPLVVGSIVGSGVFLMPTVLAPYGGLGILSVAAAGIAGLCVAMTFSDLATCAIAAPLLPSVQSRLGRIRSNTTAVATFVVGFFITAGAGSEVVSFFTLLLLAGIPMYAWVKRKEAGRTIR